MWDENAVSVEQNECALLVPFMSLHSGSWLDWCHRRQNIYDQRSLTMLPDIVASIRAIIDFTRAFLFHGNCIVPTEVSTYTA